MPNITTCTRCGAAYEACSEEAANERARSCHRCAEVVLLRHALAALVATAHGLAARDETIAAIIGAHDALTRTSRPAGPAEVPAPPAEGARA